MLSWQQAAPPACVYVCVCVCLCIGMVYGMSTMQEANQKQFSQYTQRTTNMKCDVEGSLSVCVCV